MWDEAPDLNLARQFRDSLINVYVCKLNIYCYETLPKWKRVAFVLFQCTFYTSSCQDNTFKKMTCVDVNPTYV